MNSRANYGFPLTLVVLAVAGAILVGCQDERRHQPSAAVAFAPAKPPVPDTATPAEVVQAFLTAVRDAQHARAHGLGAGEAREAYNRAMGTLGSLAAREIIYRTIKEARSNTLPLDLTPDAALTLISESWVSMAAYYVDGFELGDISVSPIGDQADAGAIVAVRAANPEDRARLKALEESPVLSNLIGDDGKPLPKNSDAYWRAMRDIGLREKPPFTVPIEAQFTIDLRRVGGAWRVARMQIGPLSGLPRPRPPVRPAIPTTSAPASQPTAGMQPSISTVPTNAPLPLAPQSAEPPPTPMPSSLPAKQP